MADPKSPLRSKTLWVNALVAVFALAYPPAAEFINGHAELVMGAFAVINMILRLVTKSAISIE